MYLAGRRLRGIRASRIVCGEYTVAASTKSSGRSSGSGGSTGGGGGELLAQPRSVAARIMITDRLMRAGVYGLPAGAAAYRWPYESQRSLDQSLPGAGRI